MKTNTRFLIVLCFIWTSLMAMSLSEPNTLSYEDVYSNTVKIMDVSTLPKELDTTFFKNSFHGQLFSDSTKNMYINIYEIERQKKGTYDVRLTLVIKDATVEQIMEQFGHKHYILVYKRKKLKRFDYSHSEI